MFGAGSKLETTHADSRFQSFICSIAKSTLELFLSGDLKEFHGAVFSSICDVARNLASVASRNAPDLYIEYLHLPQSSPSEPARGVHAPRVPAIPQQSRRAVGRPISDDAIRASIELYNGVREPDPRTLRLPPRQPRLDRHDRAVHDRPGRHGMMPEDFSPLLADLLDDVRQRQPVARDTVPVVLEGSFCEAPPIELIESIEAAGCRSSTTT